MVKVTHLSEILSEESIFERDRAIRRAFNPYSNAVDVTGCELSALIILLNLTYRKVQVDNLLDKKLANAALNNGGLISKCVDELQWFHTHNLKYPDIRVSKQNLAVDSPVLHPSVLSSANYKKTFGWSHNSAQVNLVKFFLSYFIWQGKEVCLAEVLASAESEWKSAFKALGMPVKAFVNLCGRVKGLLPNEILPSCVDKYSTQVRMPYHDGYVSLTPVVSHALQSKIQQEAVNKNGKFGQIEFTRSASVSQLAASVGGVIKALHYSPYINKKSFGLHHSRLHKMYNGKTIFNVNALVNPYFFRALDGLLFNGAALAIKQRRQQKVINIKAIRSSILSWLSPVLEWRLEVQDNKARDLELDEITDSTESQLLSVKDNELTELVMPVFNLLNETLANITSSQKYAFHPQLMTHFKAALKWLFNKITDEDYIHSTVSDEETCRYLYLRDIRVFDAQSLSNPYCIGTPSLTAVWGMIHNYQRKLNSALGTGVRFTSFSWFIKDYSIVEGKKLPEVSMQGSGQAKLRRPGIVDNSYCDLQFDLIVHIDGTDEDLSLIDEKPQILRAHFPSTLAGGAMFPPELDLAIDWCRLYSDEATLFKRLRRLPLSGRWVTPTKHKVDDLKSLLLLLSDNPELSPTMFGYMLLEKPFGRLGSIEKLHCYAEPTIGLIEYKTAIDIRLKGKESYFKKAFWMLDAQEQFMLMKGI